MKPDEICAAYRSELARLYGGEMARESRVDYSRGWYYIIVAHRYRDGSIGTGGRIATAHRKKQVLEMIEDLRGRQPKEEQ